MNKLTIGITGTGSLVGQAIIKSLLKSKLKEKYELIGCDYFEGTVGSFWVKKHHILPDFFREDITVEKWLEKVIEIIRLENISVLFVGVDFELELFATHKRTIESETGCHIIVSSLDVVNIADDKYLTYTFLKNNGLYFPETSLPDELTDENIEFPVIVKPRTGSSSKDVFVVNSEKELREKLSLVKNPIIQEFIGDDDSEYSCGVIFLENEVKEMIVLRRYLKKGDTHIAYYNKNTPQVIYDYIYQIAIKLKPFGVCNFQLRLDKQGIPKVFEINARHSGTTFMRTFFGFWEIEYILASYLDMPAEKFFLKEGRVIRFFEEMFIPNR